MLQLQLIFRQLWIGFQPRQVFPSSFSALLKSFQFRDLSECTGMCSLAFFTCTHIHDTIIPSWADSDDAIAFLSEVLKIEPMEFLVRFEQWACARTLSMYCPFDAMRTKLMILSASKPQENLQTMRANCTQLILTGLQSILISLVTVNMIYFLSTEMILNFKSVGISYRKYEFNIVSKHKVKLVGWPSAIKFANPSEIGTMDNI